MAIRLSWNTAGRMWGGRDLPPGAPAHCCTAPGLFVGGKPLDRPPASRDYGGKPRSRTPSQNPLGSRVYGMACTWPMYRVPMGNRFCYKCGLYQQSHGQKCSHNWLDGAQATRFVVDSIRQRVLTADALPRIKERLRKLAEQETACRSDSVAVKAAEAQLADLKVKLNRVGTNMAMAENEVQCQAMQKVFASLHADEQRIQAHLTELRGKTVTREDTSQEVEKALRVLDELGSVLSDPECMSHAGDLVQHFNARLFLRFRQVKQTKRVTSKLASGILTLGSAPPPIQPYQGPTARTALLDAAAQADDRIQDAPTGGVSNSSGKVELSGNVYRGDRCSPYVIEASGLRLALGLFPALYPFPGEEVLRYVEPASRRKTMSRPAISPLTTS